MAIRLDDRVSEEMPKPASGGNLPATREELLHSLKQMLQQGDYTRAALLLQYAIQPTDDYTAQQSLYRSYKKVRDRIAPTTTARLAILGGFTTHQMAMMI